jgi:subtilisin family serine protease
MKTKIIGILVCMLLIAAVVLPAAGTINEKETRKNKFIENQTRMEFVPGEFIVKVKQDRTFSSPALTALNEKHQVYALEKIFNKVESTILDNIYLLHVPMDSDILSIVRDYTSCPDVSYAEPNGIGYLCGIPNDQDFTNQWYLHNTGQTGGIPDCDIDAPEAWDLQKGNSNIIIAIIDTGVDYLHPDLASNIWNNTDEIPGNGIDDDTNGYIDDIRGWNFAWDVIGLYNDSNITDGYGHGTMCTGIPGAVTNNSIGIAGVDWNCTIMPVRIYNETGFTTEFSVVLGIKYAADNGADICSMSFGFSVDLNTIEDAINYAYSKGVFLCAAVGNNNNDIQRYPAAYENVTAVAATNSNDQRWPFSTYGDWVDIAAPGANIYSTSTTYPNPGGWSQNYSFGSGTSFSCPMVAGVAALLLSWDSSLTPDELKTLICENVDPYNSTENIGTGRINAQKALIALIDQPPNADFTWTPQNPLTNQSITFDASLSHDPDGTINLYEWDWNNDGVYEENFTIQTAIHTWDEVGNISVTLQVTDNYGLTDNVAKTITVNQHPPDNPTITGPEKGKPGSNYKYTITGIDPEEDMVSAYILWGDDTITDWTTFHNSGESFSVTHTWAKKGTYTVQVKVKDTYGAESGWTTLSVTMPFSYNIPFQPFWMKLFERFPHVFPILRHLMGC